jgi:hypothetical protein
MADRKTRKKAPAGASAEALSHVRAPEIDDAERSLGRAVALGLPLVTVVGAILVGLIASVGSGLLVLASGALLGTIALLWASVRTLSGDAPLPVDLEALAARRHGVDDLADQKNRVLRALKDLESEHALGKIDDADYGALVVRYRDDAKTVMRQMDLEVAPLREEAERIARDYLERESNTRGGVRSASSVAPPDAGRTPLLDARPKCASCHTSNDPDAAFCKKCGSVMRVGDSADASS